VDLSEGTIVIVIINVVAWAVQFAAIKTDTSWIKKRLSAGDKTLRVHERRLNTHQSRIAAIQSGCEARHPSATFPPVENGMHDGGE